MKKIVTGIIVLLCVYVFLNIWNSRKDALKSTMVRNNANVISTPLPSPPVKTSTVSWNGITYAYAYFEVRDITKLSLIDNFTQTKASESLMKDHTCQYAINGGYYDTRNRPLGLFINGTVNTSPIENPLVNGYIVISNRATILYDVPQSPTMAIQTGPMLISDNAPLLLAIKNDEYARRMVAGVSSNGILVFLAVFIPETKVQGPKLSDLPNIVTLINSTLPHPVITAINLDGGNASVFKNETTYIQEISSVGSVFCLQK
jgi:uncharacterized protein YigE (DUF2233 family)